MSEAGRMSSHLRLYPPDFSGTSGRRPFGYWHLGRVYEDGSEWRVMTLDGKLPFTLARELAGRVAAEMGLPLVSEEERDEGSARDE